MQEAIRKFLAAEVFAVAGASSHRHKYGNKVFLALLESGRKVYPINPHHEQIEGVKAYANISELPDIPQSLSIVTPPHVTREVIAQAVNAGIKNIWMQPGAEDAQASAEAREAGLNVIDDGSCLLVLLATESK